MTIYTFNSLLIAVTDERKIAAVAICTHDHLQQVSVADELRLRPTLKGRAPLMPCGTKAAYQRGCRCRPCKDAMNAWTRAHYKKRVSLNQRLNQRAA